MKGGRQNCANNKEINLKLNINLFLSHLQSFSKALTSNSILRRDLLSSLKRSGLKVYYFPVDIVPKEQIGLCHLVKKVVKCL